MDTAGRGGDQAGFEHLVAAHRGPLHAYCYRMLGSAHDADDAVQETLLAAWRGLDGFEGRGELRTWLYRIATRVCLRLAHTRNRQLPRDFGPASADVHAEKTSSTTSGPCRAPTRACCR
jgi:RNA polymerase sigma-70 factor, ECF subfamily